MQQTNEMRVSLIKEFAENYMGKLLYFCLKKTGSNTEAEDLTQDIALNIITALNKGTIPTNFSAWVWQIARNRYCAWAKEKHNHLESVTGSDIGDYEIEDGHISVLDEMIYADEISMLRRELAFIKSDYRNILVAYYIEDRSVKDIALSLSLSENTVKQRLYRARQILKEGMDMAREFGSLSYNPENIGFINNGLFGNNGEPWNYLSRLLCKNIMLAAYRTPATAEELSIEVGVALPYMEEELKALVDATLMKKNGNKYETNFLIVSAEAQEKAFAHLSGIAPELTKAVIAALEYEVALKNKYCPKWNYGYQSFNDMKWSLLMTKTDEIKWMMLNPYNKKSEKSLGIGPWGHTIRPNGGEWDILGMEDCHFGEKPNLVGLRGCVSSPGERDLPEIKLRQYKFQYAGLQNYTPQELTYLDGEAMVAVAKGRSSEVNETVLSRLESYGFIRKTDTGYQPAILVMQNTGMEDVPENELSELNSLLDNAGKIAERHYLFCRELIYKEIPDFLKDDEFQIDHACANICTIRGAVLEEAIKEGYLTLNENSKQTLGAYLII